MSGQSEPYICRNCDWTGVEPRIHHWSEPDTPLIQTRDPSQIRESYGRHTGIRGSSGSMNKCPECDKVVRTKSEWESDDFWMRWAPIIAFGFLGTIGLLLFLFD
jgi:hypothetical protein